MTRAINSNIPSIPMNRNVRLKIDWEKLGSNLVDLLTNGFSAAFGGDGVPGGTAALIKALSSLKLDPDPGARAYSLTMLGFGWALGELASNGSLDADIARRELQSALATAKALVDANEQSVPVTFSSRPTQLSLYQTLRDAVIASAPLFRTTPGEREDVLRERFDAAFERGMFEMRVRRPEVWAPIEDVLNSDGAVPVERRLNWDLYRKRVIFDFEVRPTFGQEQNKISISQLYVPLRAIWRKEDLTHDQLRDEAISQTHDIGMLDEILDQWLDNSQSSEIKLIGGGPGSGKSTTLKAFATRVAKREDWRPLFIPLQHLTLEGDLRESINRHFTEKTGSAFTQPPLTRTSVEDGGPIVLIFDGLDEISRPGESANEVVSLFTSKLHGLLSAIGGDPGERVKAVVSGRMPAFQAAKHHMSIRACDSMEVMGYAPVEGVRHAFQLWVDDQRPVWWQKYSSLFGQEHLLPEALKSAKLRTITNEPLLCYLLVLSGFATSNWESAAENNNRIYKTLISSVWRRGWGDGQPKRQGPGRELTEQDFDLLMETIAIAAWQGGDTRVASEESFHEALKLTSAQVAWDAFTIANGSDVTNLAMNFYLKSSEHAHRGFEFTHKSFGDYLAARAILRIAETFPSFSKIEFCSSEWLSVTGPGEMTSEIHLFLRDEIRLRISDAPETYSAKTHELKNRFILLATTVMENGFVATAQAGSWRASEVQQRNAEIALWCLINACSNGLRGVHKDLAEVRLTWPNDMYSLRSLIIRCMNRDEYHSSVILKCLSNVVSPNSNLAGLYLANADFSHCDLSNSVFSGSLMYSCNFERAKLNSSHFYYNMLNNSNFYQSDLRDATMVDCSLSAARITGAKVSGLRVNEVTLLSMDTKKLSKYIAKMLLFSDYHPQHAVSSISKKLNRILTLMKGMQLFDYSRHRL